MLQDLRLVLQTFKYLFEGELKSSIIICNYNNIILEICRNLLIVSSYSSYTKEVYNASIVNRSTISLHSYTIYTLNSVANIKHEISASS